MIMHDVPHESVEAEDGMTKIEWHCGLKLHDWRGPHSRDTYDGKKVIRWLEGDQTFTKQEIQEQADYIENPAAFWMRPDGDYLSDVPYTPVERHYHAPRHQTMEVELT